MGLYNMLLQREESDNPIRIGVIGAGKFGTMFLAQARITPGLHVVGIADLDAQKAFKACLRAGWPKESLVFGDTGDVIDQGYSIGKTVLTSDTNALIHSNVDIIIEMTGVPESGAYHAWNAIESGKHVVMVNVEADALLGLAIKKKADDNNLIYSMAYGDQPALICDLIDWAHTIGLEVVCAGKGTRYRPEYHYSTPDTVWKYYGFSKEKVVTGDYNTKIFNSFLDGSKSAIEMCVVANSSNLIPQRCGLQFPPVGKEHLAEILKPKEEGGILEHSGTVEVVASENRDGSPLNDDLRWGVYVIFKAPTDYVRRCFPEYGLRTDSSGSYSALYRPYHLIGLELGISIASVALLGVPTGSTQSFVADVASVAKKNLKPGDILDGEGGYSVFGRLTRAEESLCGDYLPLGLSNKTKMVRPVSKNSIITYSDIEIDENLFSYKIRKSMEKEFRI